MRATTRKRTRTALVLLAVVVVGPALDLLEQGSQPTGNLVGELAGSFGGLG